MKIVLKGSGSDDGTILHSHTLATANVSKLPVIVETVLLLYFESILVFYYPVRSILFSWFRYNK